MREKKDWRFIEVSDGVFMDADAEMKCYNLNTGVVGYRRLPSMFPDKEIITVTNEDYLEAHTVLGALENKMAQKGKDVAFELIPIDEELRIGK